MLTYLSRHGLGLIRNYLPRDFPGGPVVKTPRFHCRGPGILSLVGELRSNVPRGAAKKRKKATGLKQKVYLCFNLALL